MTPLSSIDLAAVTGGQEYNNPAFGRCGPGAQDIGGIMGNVYTPQCAAHDAAVKANMEAGNNGFMSHLKALPLLPAAVGSWAANRFNPNASAPA